MTGSPPVVLAIDPGRGKCGMAVLDGSHLLARRVVPIGEMAATAARWTRDFRANIIALGNRTAGDEVRALLAAALPAVPIVMVDEAGTTQAARRRYFAEHAPRGWRRLLPLGMQIPPEPYDDYVAILLAERFLRSFRTPGGAPQNAHLRPSG